MAMLAATLLKDPPIYDSLRERALPADAIPAAGESKRDHPDS
jgi:hypothetical protein